MSPLLTQALVWLAAAVIAVPVASRLGLGSVLGYLLAGVAIGPFALGLVQDSESVMHFAELGVVMMLFLVGLELDPQRLWRLRGPVFGLGGLQVLATTAVITPLALLAGLPWQQALAVGLILSMSSTAIALQSLTERGLLGTHGGQTTFAVLLLQDVAVIPILALFPLLATLPVHHANDHATSLIAHLPAWQQAIAVLGAILAVIGIGRLVVTPLMRAVARTGLRELFTAAALLIVISITVLMSSVGLSAALGTFIAGVVLASSEYRHELVSDIDPFKGLLLGVFFMAVGAGIDLHLLAAAPLAMTGLAVGILAVKVAVLVVVARVGRLVAAQISLLAVALAQVGEFAFVLLNFAQSNGILGHDTSAPLVAATALTMAASPFLLLLHERVLAPRLAPTAAATRDTDVEDEGHPVIIAGYGRFGQIAGRLLRAHGVGVTVVDVDAEQVDALARFGNKVFYGDASRLDLLHAAGAQHATVLIIAVDDPDKVIEIADLARKHYPQLAILARARGRTESFELLDRDVEGVYRETFDTALRAGTDALRLLGHTAHAAHRAGAAFAALDERMLRDLRHHRHEGEAYITRVRERARDFQQTLAADAHIDLDPADHGWDSAAIREVVTTIEP